MLRYTSSNMARTPRVTVDNSALLEAALEGLELQRSRIEGQIEEVRRLLGKRKPRAAKSDATTAADTASKKRELSPAARKRIAAAQKRRWAEYRKKTGSKDE